MSQKNVTNKHFFVKEEKTKYLESPIYQQIFTVTTRFNVSAPAHAK